MAEQRRFLAVLRYGRRIFLGLDGMEQGAMSRLTGWLGQRAWQTRTPTPTLDRWVDRLATAFCVVVLVWCVLKVMGWGEP